MKALEIKAGVQAFVTQENHEKNIHHHRERLKRITKTIKTDSGSPKIYSPRHKARRIAEKEAIAKDNLLLAQRLFNIMDNPSRIKETIKDTRHLDCHPGTMNFNHRLAEAQRIHNQNMLIASRLDTVQPYYKKSDLCVVMKIDKKNKKNKKTRNDNKNTFDKELEEAYKIRSKFNENNVNISNEDYSDYGNGYKSPTNNNSSGSRAHNVILEYTKIQDGRLLDIAVIKEPFRDRYAVFGIDADDGQRFELRLSSEEVSNIVDGDMLVTSVENIEVWMALLNKVYLNPVDSFTKVPHSNSQNNENGSQLLTTPSRPFAEKPSHSSAVRQEGSRGPKTNKLKESIDTSKPIDIDDFDDFFVTDEIKTPIVKQTIKEDAAEEGEYESIRQVSPPIAKPSINNNNKPAQRPSVIKTVEKVNKSEPPSELPTSTSTSLLINPIITEPIIENIKFDDDDDDKYDDNNQTIEKEYSTEFETSDEIILEKLSINNNITNNNDTYNNDNNNDNNYSPLNEFSNSTISDIQKLVLDTTSDVIESSLRKAGPKL